MRLAIVLATTVLGAACHGQSAALNATLSSELRAVVSADSAIFVVPISPRASWEWNTPDTSQLGSAQYAVKALWKSSESWQGEGVGLRLMEPVSPNPRRGSLAELISIGRAIAVVPSRRIAGWETSYEPNASARVRDNSIVLVLRRSEMLRRLNAVHPREVYFEVRMPKDTQVSNHSVTVEYR